MSFLPSNLCDSTGLVMVLASDGEGYEPAACLGCVQCRTLVPAQRGRDAYQARAARAGGAFALIPGSADEDEAW